MVCYTGALADTDPVLAARFTSTISSRAPHKQLLRVPASHENGLPGYRAYHDRAEPRPSPHLPAPRMTHNPRITPSVELHPLTDNLYHDDDTHPRRVRSLANLRALLVHYVVVRYGWSLDRAEWDLFLSLCAAGLLADWKRTRLDSVYRDSVPEAPGIYAICSKAAGDHFPPGLYNVLYVGKAATALRDRFLHHCDTPSPELKRAQTSFGPVLDYWYLTAPKNLVSQLESSLITCLGPSVNQRSGIRATLGPAKPA